MPEVKISVIVPCFNQAKYLEEALESVLAQTCQDWECIVVNDGSTDSTEEISQKWITRDDRFKYIYQRNSGVSSARNNAIAISSGEYILPLDADDKISPNYIALAVRELESNGLLKLVYCLAKKFGAENSDWELGEYSLSNLASSNMIFCSAVFRRKDWKEVGGYDLQMDVGFEDWEFWIAILKKGGEVKQLKHVGFYYRIKEESRTRNLDQEKKNRLFEYMSVKHADFFVSQCGSFFSLRSKIGEIKMEHQRKLKSEKFVVDVFLKTFFGISLFGKYN